MSTKNKSKINVHTLFIVENNAVPTDIRVWREAKTVKRAGYEVTIISPKDRKYTKKYEIIEGIKVYRYPAFSRKIGKLYQIFEYAHALLWEIFLSVKIFIKSRFWIIHGANPPDHIFIIASIFRIFGVKYIFDHHDLSPELYVCKFDGAKNVVYYMLKMMERVSCFSADIVISTNESYKKHIITNHNAPKEKIYVVRNDPELQIQKENEKQELNDKHYVLKLLYLGSINIQDGVETFIKAIDILVNEFYVKNIQCLVIGDGDALPEIKKLCHELEMEPYFKFLGYIYDRDKVIGYLKEADICLETAPDNEANRKSTFIKIMEYMAAGKPVVAFDLEETRFTVKDSAILVQPGDIHAYVKAIYKLIKEPLTRKKLGHSGQKRIIEELNWERASSQLISAYQSLIM